MRLDHQPARRREPAAGDQRAGARHRQGRDGSRRAAAGATTTIALMDALPLLAAGPATGAVGQLALGAARARPRAARLSRPRRRVADGLSRSDRQTDRDGAAGIGVDCDRQDARPERLPAGSARGSQRGRREPRREPRRAGVGRARVREPRAGAVARRLRRSPVAAVRRRRRAGHARRPRLDDDAAQRQGPRVSGRRAGRPRGRAVSALAIERGRGGARGGAAALLRRHDARPLAPGADRRRAPPNLRRVPVQRAVAVHRRGAGRARRAHRGLVLVVLRLPGQLPALRVPDQPVRPRPARQAKREPTYAYEDEDQSTGIALRLGHEACGIRSSASAPCSASSALDDDTKLVVRFAAVGQKTLRAKYARLEPA